MGTGPSTLSISFFHLPDPLLEEPITTIPILQMGKLRPRVVQYCDPGPQGVHCSHWTKPSPAWWLFPEGCQAWTAGSAHLAGGHCLGP